MKLVAVVAVAELEKQPLLRVPYPPYDILVVRTDAGVYALEDACNHAGASLAEGHVEGACIICPMHGYAFDLATGVLVRPKKLCADQRVFVCAAGSHEVRIYDPFTLAIAEH